MMIKQAIKNILPYGIVKRREDRIMQARQQETISAKLPYRTDTEPLIYNRNGEKMRTFYLEDFLTTEYPYSFVYSASPSYINWDRFNYGLPVHFYTHDNVLRVKDTAQKRFAYFIESKALLGNDYTLFDKNPGLSSEFNAIFTTDDEQLEKYPNAKFCPAGGLWYGQSAGGGELKPDRHLYKTKDISIISSDKMMCELHKARIAIAEKMKKERLADTFGTFDGGPKVKICETLDDYRFSIAIENNVTSYYFTEKIMNCFAAQTVPIYIGAEKIGKFFNTDGIIMTTDEEMYEHPEKVLAQCTPQEYEQRKDAILDNYERVKEYAVIEDYLFRHYRNLF